MPKTIKNPTIYYLYTENNKLTHIRLIMGMDSTHPVSDKDFKPLYTLAKVQFAFSDNDLKTLHQVLTPLVAQTKVKNKQKICHTVCSYKIADITTFSSPPTENYIDLTLSLEA